MTVQYFLSDPTNGNKAYKLESDPTKFGSLSLYLGYQNLVGQNTSVTEFSAFNNGGGTATKKRYGREYFRRIGKLGGKARSRKPR